MKSVNVFWRVLCAVVVSLGIALVWSSAAQAHPVGHTTIHAAECATGSGSAIFEECHDNALQGMTFTFEFAATTVELVTDVDGVTGTSAEAGELAISVDPGDAADYLGIYVYCSNQLTGEVLVDEDLGGFTGIAFDLPSHESGTVVCDWYFITPASSGGTTVSTLPATGTGSSGMSDQMLPIALLVGGFFLFSSVAIRKHRTALK